MKVCLLFVCILFIHGCAYFKQKSTLEKLEDEGYSLAIGCEIYNLEGNLLRSFPGEHCLFFDDGSLLSYDPKRQELSKFNSNLSKEWSIHKHVHHMMTTTRDNNILVKSSSFHEYNGKKNVRFDDLILINLEGQILGEFSFYETISKLNKIRKRGPQKTAWDKNISFEFEATHLPSAYEIHYPIEKDGKVFAPKGSFIVSLNTLFSGIYILSSDLSRIIGFSYALTMDNFHDVQQYSGTEVIYFLNNLHTKPEISEKEAKIVVQDLLKQKYTHVYAAGFYALFGGGVQFINEDLLLVSDLKSRFGKSDLSKKDSTNEADRIREHAEKKGRVVLYSPKKGILHEIHFAKAFSNAKLMKLKPFMSKMISF